MRKKLIIAPEIMLILPNGLRKEFSKKITAK